MVKAPGYMDNEYEATKARLNQKYGGNRRQVQAHLDELRKMRPIHADNPRKLERFANIVERTVVSLKENKKFADLEGGMQLCWKNFLKLYLASTTDGLKKGKHGVP